MRRQNPHFVTFDLLPLIDLCTSPRGSRLNSCILHLSFKFLVSIMSSCILYNFDKCLFPKKMQSNYTLPPNNTDKP